MNHSKLWDAELAWYSLSLSIWLETWSLNLVLSLSDYTWLSSFLQPDSERIGSNLCTKGTARDGGADGKVIIERLCISLPYVETFNSKVMKGFVPELRSGYVFFVFRDSYGLCIYVLNILCTFHISVSWVWYRRLLSLLGFVHNWPTSRWSATEKKKTGFH